MKIIAVLAAAFAIAAAAPADAAEFVVDQKNKKFLPKSLSVKLGDTLVFRNSEKKKIRHNVYSKTKGFEFVKIKIQKPGQSNKIKLTKAGTFEVRCSFHPRMKMKVSVAN